MENLKDKFIQVVVNGRTKPIPKTAKKVPMEIIVSLAFGSYEKNKNRAFTITYAKGKDGRGGSLVEGDMVNVIEGMIFNVTATDLA